MQICAINSGYWDTKAYNGRQLVKFRTKMSEATETIINTTNTFKINFEGKDYLLGEGADKYTLEYDKTLSPLHKISTYYALHRFTDLREDFKIVVALPLNYYSSLKQSYEAYLKSRESFAFTVDGTRRYLNVLDCKVFPEGVAALYANDPQKYKNDNIGIIDIGSLTINGCIMSNHNLIKESIFTINAGTIILNNKLRKELNNRFMLNLRDYEMPLIIRSGLRVHGSQRDTQQIIDSVIKDHIEEVILEMRKNNWPIESLKVLLTGGGSLLLESYLKTMLPSSFMGNDPIYDNVKGLYAVAGVIFV